LVMANGAELAWLHYDFHGAVGKVWRCHPVANDIANGANRQHDHVRRKRRCWSGRHLRRNCRGNYKVLPCGEVVVGQWHGVISATWIAWKMRCATCGTTALPYNRRATRAGT